MGIVCKIFYRQKMPLFVREMFVEGPIKADSFDALLRDRATYLEKTYAIPFDEYQRKSVSEFEKIRCIPNHTEAFMVLTTDLFCFVNLLFMIQILIKNKTLKLSLVRPLRKRNLTFGRDSKSHKIRFNACLLAKNALSKSEI
jgi:hypothetical protein